MKQLLSLLIILPFSTWAQVNFSTKTSYRYDKIDGWVRIIESEWFTINSRGDTTYWSEIKEDTQQEDPGIKKDTVAVLIPTSVFKIGSPEPEIKETEIAIYKDTISGSSNLTSKDFLRADTFLKIINKKSIRHTNKTKLKNSVKYRTKWRNPKKAKYPKSRKIKEPLPLPEIKLITYDTKLWLVVKANGKACVVEGKTKQAVIKKIASTYISITEFSEGSIIR